MRAATTFVSHCKQTLSCSQEFMPQLEAMAQSCGSFLNAIVLTTSDVQSTLVSCCA